MSVRWATAPDGYHTSGQPLLYTILIAYFPQGMAYWKDRVSGGPSWLNDKYDIDAKVSEADLPAWRKEQNLPLAQKVMFTQMLQRMLVERCHLVTHRVPGQMDGFFLEAGKKGPHIKETAADEVLPKGIPLPSGGVLVGYQRGEPYHAGYHGATMADLANQLSMSSNGHPVEDHTGLTARYDFDIGWIGDPEHPERDGVIMFDDPNPVSHYDVEALGLRVAPVKIAIDNMVIDHIEKPSEN